MSLNEFLPSIDRLSRQDKPRLIYVLLLTVAKEEGCNLEPIDENDSESVLLHQLASTGAVVWSPQADCETVQALSDLLVASKETSSIFKSENSRNIRG